MQVGPWWFGSVMTLGGVIIGIAAKWIIDLVTESSRRDREDRLRFIEVRRDAYARLITDGTMLLVYRAGAKSRTKQGEVPSYLPSADEIGANVVKLRMSTLETASLVQLLGPDDVGRTAMAYWRALLNGDHQDVVDAQEAFRRAAREDLGVPPTDA